MKSFFHKGHNPTVFCDAPACAVTKKKYDADVATVTEKWRKAVRNPIGYFGANGKPMANPEDWEIKNWEGKDAKES